MANEILNVDNADNAGEDETVSANVASTLENDNTLLHIFNNFNVSVDVTITGTRAGDSDFSEGVEINSQSLSAGGNAGYYVVSDPWEQVQVTLSPGGDPTSGSVSVHRMDDN